MLGSIISLVYGCDGSDSTFEKSLDGLFCEGDSMVGMFLFPEREALAPDL